LVMIKRWRDIHQIARNRNHPIRKNGKRKIKSNPRKRGNLYKKVFGKNSPGGSQGGGNRRTQVVASQR